MKIKKRAKKVILSVPRPDASCTDYVKYTCPHCHAEIYDYDICARVLRFICANCEEELIVSKIIKTR